MRVTTRSYTAIAAQRMLRQLAVLIICAAAAMAAGGQASPSAVVYRSQYIELKSKAVDLMERVAKSRVNAAALREERLALLTLIHRLEEEALTANGQRSAKGQTSD